MTSTLVCIFALLAVGTIFSLPLEPKFTSTLNTPLLDEREVFTHDHSELALNGTEATKRGLEESESTEDEFTSTEKIVERQMNDKIKNKASFRRAHDEDEEEEEESTITTKKNPKKLVKDEKEDSSVESEEQLTTLSGRLAEFVPTLFDSVWTPAGTQLQFDENHQSIDRPTTELFEDTTEKAIEEEKKEKRLTLVQLNQGQNATLVEEKKSDH